MRVRPHDGLRRVCGPGAVRPLVWEDGVMTPTMERVSINGAELEVAIQGAGEAIVFIHGAGFADSYLSLADDPAVRDHYRTIRYRRRGFGGSGRVDGRMPVSAHASDCQALLDALGVG